MFGFVSAVLLFAAAVNALSIDSPSAGSKIYRGKAFSVMVSSGGDSATQASVLFKNGGSSYSIDVNVGSAQSVVLPDNFNGYTTVTASPSNGSGSDASSYIYVVGNYNPCYNPCYYPCYNPCYYPRYRCYTPRYGACNIPRAACNIPRAACNIPRPRYNRCRIRSEDSSSIESFESSSSPQIIYSGFSVYVADDALAADEELFFQQYEQEQQAEQEQQQQQQAQEEQKKEQQEEQKQEQAIEA